MTTATTTDIRRNTSAEATGQMTAEALRRDAERLLANCGALQSRSWVSRTVRDYLRRTTWHGIPFGAFLLSRVQLNAEQRRRAWADPELHSFLAYADPTGESAVRNVMAGA